MSSESFLILSNETLLCRSDRKQNVDNNNNNNRKSNKSNGDNNAENKNNEKTNEINNCNKTKAEDNFDSLTLQEDEKLNDDNYRHYNNNENKENFNVGYTIKDDECVKTSLEINGDKQNISTVDDKECAGQKCDGQKTLSSSFERRERHRVKAKTGYGNTVIRGYKYRRGCCNLSMLNVLVAVIIYHLLMIERVSGGICWASMQRNGKCKELTAEKISKEECCAAGQSPGTAWSSEDLDPGALFFWKVLGGGVPCNACRETCSGVKCGSGRRCAIRRGRPRCVCAPRCGGGRAGPVCGTDGRSYRSLCRLRKRACRRRTRDLTLDYYGHCQHSCSKIRCGSGRHCLLDQDSRAHCVRCARSCPRTSHADHESKALCGADGVTYSSTCHLQAAACRKGKSIPLAYKGPCDSSATCETVRCRPRQNCLIDWETDTPRCVTCSAKCPYVKGTLCATNNRTYTSWCHMIRDACITGYVLETKHVGACGAGDLDLFLMYKEEDE